MRSAYVLTVCCWLFGVAALTRAQAPSNEGEIETSEIEAGATSSAAPAVDSDVMRAIEARLVRLRVEIKREGGIRTALEQAELALVRARGARAARDEPRALRAEQIAEAATVLAERRLARSREQEAISMTLARRKEAEAQARAAHENLEVAQKHAREPSKESP